MARLGGANKKDVAGLRPASLIQMTDGNGPAFDGLSFDDALERPAERVLSKHANSQRAILVFRRLRPLDELGEVVEKSGLDLVLGRGSARAFGACRLPGERDCCEQPAYNVPPGHFLRNPHFSPQAWG